MRRVVADHIKSKTVNITQLLGELWRSFESHFPDGLRTVAISMPSYLEGHEQFPTRLDGMLDSVAKLNTRLQMRPRAMVSVCSEFQGVFAVKNVEIMQHHRDEDLALVDAPLVDKDQWIRTWSYMLQPILAVDETKEQQNVSPLISQRRKVNSSHGWRQSNRC